MDLLFYGHVGLVWVRVSVHTAVRALSRWFPWLVAPPPKPRWEITTALAFGRDGEFRELTRRTFTPETWEDYVHTQTQWSPELLQRVEVRYAFISAFGKRAKYRLVLRPGDTCPPLPPPSPTISHPPILTATLMPHDGVGSPVDVTTRLRKYAGPHKDFHAGTGLRVHCEDILPLDDWDYVVERFRHLVVLDMHFKKHVFDLRDGTTPIALTHDKKNV